MGTQYTIPVTQARKDIFSILRNVQKGSIYYTLTEKGISKAVIMSAEEFESWAETLHVLSESPDLENDVSETDADIKNKHYKDYISLDELLAEEGYIVADKSRRIYEVPSKSKTKSAKKSR